jgi:hypothetical protein
MLAEIRLPSADVDIEMREEADKPDEVVRVASRLQLR